MIGRHRNSTSNARRGFTLLEVLLTLCMLVIIMGLAWPVVKGPIDTLRLRRTADEVHAQWASARVEAMDSGRTYMFRHSLGEEQNDYRITCYSATESTGDPVHDETFDGSAGGLGLAGAPREPITGTLPEGIMFLVSETEADNRAVLTQAVSGGSDADSAEWSTPILFYPDGTTSNSVLQLRNDRNSCIELSLRGLTGMVTIGKVTTAEEHLQ